MPTPEPEDISLDEFRLMTQRAGLPLSHQEIEELKPLYDLYYEYVRQLHSIDLKAEEIGLTFRPDWPSS